MPMYLTQPPHSSYHSMYVAPAALGVASSFLLAVTAPTKPPRPFRERHTPEMRTDTQGAACVRPTLFFLLLFMAAELTSYMPTHSPRDANDFGPQQTNQARSE